MKFCIVQPGVNKVSETFIAAHAKHLPGDVTVVHHAESVVPHVNGGPVLSQSLARRGVRKVGRLLARKEWDWEITTGYLKAFRTAGAQAVLAEYGTTGVRVMEACRLARLPLIVHYHGYDASMHAVLATHASAYRAMFRQAAAIVAVSRAMEKKMIDLGAPPEKVYCNHYGVNVERFVASTPAANPPTFLAVGRFVEKKAPQLTLLAFQKVLQECSDARLRMIGEGNLLGPCRDLAQGLEIEAKVNFLGAQPHGVVAAEMQKARAFVQHSVEASSGDCEGTPNSVLEAGASGLPVVATRHAGIPDVVIDGETGLLVDERDVDGMATQMLRLADDPRLAGSFGRAARQRIETYFSMNRSIGRLWEIIQSSIEGRAPQLQHATHDQESELALR